jgi:heme A synthase
MNNQGGDDFMKTTTFARYAWGVLGYNLLVILWGAFVRATGSGAGCGSHWPLCNGELIPRAPAIETLVELSHRLTSGLALVLMAVLLVWAWRIYPQGHRVRSGAVFSMIFLLVEALIGAGLVLFEYVAANVSLARAYWIAGHLLNTFLLLAALTLTAWWATGGAPLRLRGQGSVGWLLGAGVAGLLILGADGGITALGDTLVLTAGIAPAESAIVAGLVKLRLYHPLLALVVGVVVVAAARLASAARAGMATRRFSRWVIGLFVGQLVLGALNVALKAPVWIQLAHLLLADLIWITFILLSAAALAYQTAHEEDATRKSILRIQAPKPITTP